MTTAIKPIPHSTRPAQIQTLYSNGRGAVALNSDLMFLAKNGVTREELQQNIESFPSLWSRFSCYVSDLPSREANIPQ